MSEQEPRLGRGARSGSAWWADSAFWEEMFDFIFPPEQLALGAEVASSAAALLGLSPGAKVLDLGCGPGRVSVALARAGYRVTGVDAQPGYLARARAWAERDGVALELLRGDLAEIAFGPEFDAVLSLFTSFGYFAEPAADRRVLERAWNALRPGGRLLLETAHRDGVVRLLRPRELQAPDGRRWREEPRFDLVSGVLEERWTLASPAGERQFETRLRPYSATELDEMLRTAGYRDVRFYGGLRGGPPSLDAYTIVAVGERPVSA